MLKIKYLLPLILLMLMPTLAKTAPPTGGPWPANGYVEVDGHEIYFQLAGSTIGINPSVNYVLYWPREHGGYMLLPVTFAPPPVLKSASEFGLLMYAAANSLYGNLPYPLP